MSTLLSPPTTRHRASSTSLRPPLSLPSLAPRRRSSSLSVSSSSSSSSTPSPSDSSPPDSPLFSCSPVDIPPPKPSSSMIPVVLDRCIQLLRAAHLYSSPKHARFMTPTSICSPRSSTDSDYILPLSASHLKTSFDDVPSPHKSPDSLSSPSTRISAHAPLLVVVLLFPLSTAFTLFCLSTLPISASWPRTLSDLAVLGQELNAYSQSGLLPTTHILGVLSVTAVWKHAWSVPGSVLWNVLAGALFHPLLATLLMTSLTTIGSLCSTLLSAPLAPVLSRVFPRPLELTRSALEGSADVHSKNSTPAWVRLSILRLIGVVPWSGLNIACGLTGVALRDCALGAFIGTLPWTAVTCQIGDILQTVTSGASDKGDGARTVTSLLSSPEVVFELIFLSFLSLAPILGRDWLRRFISPPVPDSTTPMVNLQIDSEKLEVESEKSPSPRSEKRLSPLSFITTTFRGTPRR
ncbi:hypothetical protein BD410DRAFT_780001 [Rickenella mellea]|uniref:VTT domain-containing protein n=1 Tax=Rickenella mellea TaxID=50990 RepID=A0A4R5XEK4_9AGAM|nr:hypothetical protein BD410DRAFT_780001 [Rickenella mellea]